MAGASLRGDRARHRQLPGDVPGRPAAWATPSPTCSSTASPPSSWRRPTSAPRRSPTSRRAAWSPASSARPWRASRPISGCRCSRRASCAVIVIHAIVFTVLGFIEFPAVKAEDPTGPQRPLLEIVTQPAYMVAGAGAMIAFGVMSFVMAASPLAIVQCGLEQDRGADHHLRARHGHVRAGLLHRPPDRALRRVQHHDRRHRAADAAASPSP